MGLTHSCLFLVYCFVSVVVIQQTLPCCTRLWFGWHWGLGKFHYGLSSYLHSGGVGGVEQKVIFHDGKVEG